MDLPEQHVQGPGDTRPMTIYHHVPGKEQIVAALPADHFPHFSAFIAEHNLQPGHSFGASFEVGLDLVLDGPAARSRARRPGDDHPTSG